MVSTAAAGAEGGGPREVRDDDLDWIRGDTATGGTIRSGVPGGFEAYGLLDLEVSDDALLLDALAAGAEEELVAGWILKNGLVQEEGAEHLLYARWPYRLRRTTVSALRQRPADSFPDLLFPPDRRWMVTTLWDDGWRSIGADSDTALEIERRFPAFERIDPDVEIAGTGREVR